MNNNNRHMATWTTWNIVRKTWSREEEEMAAKAQPVCKGEDPKLEWTGMDALFG